MGTRDEIKYLVSIGAEQAQLQRADLKVQATLDQFKHLSRCGIVDLPCIFCFNATGKVRRVIRTMHVLQYSLNCVSLNI